MATIEPYKDIFISQPTGEGGVLINNNFKTLADDNYEKTTQIANITANYSLKTETQVVANNLSAEIASRIESDNTVFNSLNSTILNVSGEIQGQIDQLYVNFSSTIISGASISGDNLYLVGNAYSMGERLARISEVGGSQAFAASANAYIQSVAVTTEASGNIMNYVSNLPTGSVTYNQITYDATDLTDVIAPSGNFNLLIIKNCASPLTFGTPVNMSNGQTVKIILEPPSPGSSMYVTMPVSGYSSITQALFDSLWTSTGTKPAAAMFEYTKLNSAESTKICSVVYTSLESI